MIPHGRGLTRRLIALAVLASLSGCGFTAASTAQAPTTTRPAVLSDAAFLTEMHRAGVDDISDDLMVEVGHRYCTHFHRDFTVGNLVNSIRAEGGTLQVHFALLMRTAIRSFCPQFTDEVDAAQPETGA